MRNLRRAMQIPDLSSTIGTWKMQICLLLLQAGRQPMTGEPGQASQAPKFPA